VHLEAGSFTSGAKKENSRPFVKNIFSQLDLMKIGILCAIPKEIHFFKLLPNSGQQVGGRTFFKSKHSFHELIIVECGIGKVNSAMVSTILIQEFKCEILIFSGIAGGIDPDMEIGEVLIGEFLIQYDYGALKDGDIRVYRAGEIPMGIQKNKAEFVLDPVIKEKIISHFQMSGWVLS